MYLNSTYGHLQWLLNKWDKASMASSVEIRSPFLDWRFFQYGLALPGELKIKDGYNKSILRETFRSFLPNQIMDKKIKQGLPIKEMKNTNEMQNQIKEIINQNDFLENDIWDGKAIKADFENLEKRNNEALDQISRQQMTLKVGDDFSFRYENELGHEYGKSTGERLLFNLIFVSCLIQFARERANVEDEFVIHGTIAPFLIDAPVGALDKAYRERVTDYIKSNTDQLIFLLSTKDWESVDEIIKDISGI